MAVLSEQFRDEQRDYFLSTSQWTDTHPQQLLGPPSAFKRYDLHTLTLEDLKAPMVEAFQMHVSDGGPVEALCGWFDVAFKGSETNPTDVEVPLSTAPDPTGSTHWGQQTFYISPPLQCDPTDKLDCKIDVSRRLDNQRLLAVKMDIATQDVNGTPKPGAKTQKLKWNID
ncbi:hypothetical protein FOA52_008157 [Chlamydomonas sp. UWO 241]|nr:hypothetical protein FOA52_008157 [Chlamydomonas sp. UWO 241]